MSSPTASRHYRGHDHTVIKYSDYKQVSLLPHLGHRDRLAVIYADGAIQQGQGGFDPLLSPGGNGMGSDDMVDALDQARDDDSVRAVILRINSPGGSVIASELIRRAAELLAKEKPLVVSMSGYAASGGYWIAMPAAKIFAEPATITGSIGVLGGKFNIAPLMNFDRGQQRRHLARRQRHDVRRVRRFHARPAAAVPRSDPGRNLPAFREPGGATARADPRARRPDCPGPRMDRRRRDKTQAGRRDGRTRRGDQGRPEAGQGARRYKARAARVAGAAGPADRA